MKKLFLTAVAVLAFSFTGNAKQNQEFVYEDCFQLAIDTYDAVLASTGSMRYASVAADAVYDSCNMK